MKGSSFPFYPMSYRTLVRLCRVSGDLSALCGDHYLERCDESVEVGRFGTESLAAHAPGRSLGPLLRRAIVGPKIETGADKLGEVAFGTCVRSLHDI